MRLVRRTAMLLVALLTAGAGLVALSVGSAAATTVSDEVGFRSAWGNPNEQQIDLTADITLTCPGGEALRNSSTPITVNGNAHTIRQTCAGQRVQSRTEHPARAAATARGCGARRRPRPALRGVEDR